MPTLALLVCFLLAFWLLAKDAKKYPRSATIWLPTLWMMRCASRNIDYWLGGGEGGRWDPVLVALVIVAGVIILARRQVEWSKIFGHNSAIFIFYFYIALSVTWAGPLDTAVIKILRPLADLLMALTIVTEKRPLQAIMAMGRRMAILLVPLSFVLIRYFPYLGRMQDKHWGSDSWIGVTTHKNPLGQLCMISLLSFLWTLAESRREGKKILRPNISWLYILLTLYLMSGGGAENSRSSTSILCLIIALALYFWFGLMRRNIQAVIRRMTAAAVALIVFALVLEVFDTSLQAFVAELSGKDATLSDRTYLWSDVIRIGMDNPMLGTGYGNFWVPSVYPKLSPMVDNSPAEAHNGYLETFANLGLVGVGLLFLVILQAISSATRVIRVDFEYGRIRLALILMVVAMNYSEAVFPRGSHVWWFSFLVVALYARDWVWKASVERQPETGQIEA